MTSSQETEEVDPPLEAASAFGSQQGREAWENYPFIPVLTFPGLGWLSIVMLELVIIYAIAKCS